MPIVSEIVEHIIHHVVAEASTVDQSQTDGVQDRADYALDAIDIYIDDNRDLDRVTFLRELAASGKPGFLKGAWITMLINAEDDERSRLTIQNWVGKNEESRGG